MKLNKRTSSNTKENKGSISRNVPEHSNPLPKHYNHTDAETKWQAKWEEWETYRWDPTQPREATYSVDTPPPTVSGSLHIGHVFSYTQTDVQVRYNRMQGKNIFYPMGWDDNGLPTERRVQNVYGINCNPSLPYDPNWTPSVAKKDLKRSDFQDVSRQNFIEACDQLTQQDEVVFEQLWRRLGLSIDWNLQYATIDDHCRKLSQLSFLDLVEKKKVVNLESPTMWDVDFQTAVAQAEIEDRDQTGAYHDIEFSVEEGGSFIISTTRPELLAACIAVVAHPDDPRYQSLFGKFAITPLFHARVPILSAEHADPEKGTGILMVCTFGDAMDVEFWKKSGLPIKQIVGRSGCLLPVDFSAPPFTSKQPETAQAYYAELVGLRVKKARTEIARLLALPNSGREGNPALIGEPKPIVHPVKFYEKGDSPIEFISTRQWFVTILAHKAELLAQGNKIQWHPGYMKSRYDNWVQGLNQEWCISRQRFFGVPFPVWYPVRSDGEPDYANPIYPSPEQLPVDPLIHCPQGYTSSQRNQPGGFCGDPDVMDTWATSSLTPQIMSHWGLDETRHRSVFPFDVRPQSHEIIRTWAFYTIAKAWMHEGQIPWKHVAISGWILDPDRKKMSKSKGNVITPEHLLDTFSSDAIRYWSAKAKLGADTAFDESVFLIGKKLVTKLFNASKFVMIQIADAENLTTSDITHPVDCAYVSELQTLIASATRAFDAMDYAAALEVTESAFWEFCDHYIELVKTRAYREENVQKKRSAMATLDWALSVFCRLLAPFCPFITDEVWSWRYSTHDVPSIHKAVWPDPNESTPNDSIPSGLTQKEAAVSAVSNALTGLIPVAIQVLSAIRTAKTQAQKGMKHPVAELTILHPPELKTVLNAVQEDIASAGSVERFVYQDAKSLECRVALAGDN